MKISSHADQANPRNRPLVRRSQAERTALSDRLLTEAAIELIVESGDQGTTLQAVGERAGYSRALATHRFGSKAGLLANVARKAGADWVARVEQAVGDRVGVEALCAATDAAERYIRECPNEVRALYILWFLSIDIDTEYRPNIANVHRTQRRDVERWIRSGKAGGSVDADISPARVAEQYVASMAGIAYQWLMNREMPLGLMYRQLKANLRQQLQPSRASRTARQPSARRQAGVRAHPPAR